MISVTHTEVNRAMIRATSMDLDRDTTILFTMIRDAAAAKGTVHK